MTTLRNTVLLAAIALAFVGSTTRCLAGASCVPASRYTALAAITQGDTRRLALSLGIGNALPPADACRAILLTGPLDDALVSAALDAIRKNRGWLAVVYLAFEDGDIVSEARLAQVLRDYHLASVLLLTDVDYVPDFVKDTEKLPASVSYAWLERERTLAGALDERLDDYMKTNQRRIARGSDRCGVGCATALAASADRGQYGLVALMRGDPKGASQQPKPSPDAAEAHAELRRRFGVSSTPFLKPYGWASGAFPRWPDGQKEIIAKNCASQIDYATARGTELAKSVDDYEDKLTKSVADTSDKHFPHLDLSKLVPVVKAVRMASTNVERCAMQVLDRERHGAFVRLCGKECSTQSMRQAIDAEVAAHDSPQQHSEH